MRLICKKNKFLENLLNMKNIKEEFLAIKVDGVTEVLSNLEMLQRFLNEATPGDLKQFQQFIAIEKYSTKSINEFLKMSTQHMNYFKK